jgi:hypothetical protein
MSQWLALAAWANLKARVHTMRPFQPHGVVQHVVKNVVEPFHDEGCPTILFAGALSKV